MFTIDYILAKLEYNRPINKSQCLMAQLLLDFAVCFTP